MKLERMQITVSGIVQGVGFRPHVYRLAKELSLTGWVQNNADGVLIEIQGINPEQIIDNLKQTLPPLAKIETVQAKFIPPEPKEGSFEIIASGAGCDKAMISPDMGVCDACLKELFDPNSHYYLYPFLNCTQCGPRLTITHTLPYDRTNTAMGGFPLCAHCEKDYTNPFNRRYHAQPTACRACGPKLSAGFQEIAERIKKGDIVAIKGLGGYQLICDAQNEKAVATLRRRKNRVSKPFALMVANVQSAKKITELSPLEQSTLTSLARPIVLLKQHNNNLPDNLAPGLSHLGIMLPTTPIHYLLFHALAGFPDDLAWLEKALPFVLVATSANMGGNPLIIEEDKAEDALSAIADFMVHHNRDIVTRNDDSVLKVIHDKPAFIRRARGYVPKLIKLPHPIPSTLALGGHLKNTFCITRHDEAFVSQYIGSLTNKETIDFFHESLSHWQNFLKIKIERVAHDKHPDFYTTQLAQHYDLECIPVQHHHAHLASIAAEHHVLDPAIGLVLDGYGYGMDGEAWGGELMLLEKTSCHHLGSFMPLTMPGGELAAREPWRMATSVLHELGVGEDSLVRFKQMPHIEPIAKMLASKQTLWPKTSSCGRYFDAASALLNINILSDYEGHAAQMLESLVIQPKILHSGWTFENGYFNILPMFKALLELDPIAGANLFHGTLIAGLTEWVMDGCRKASVQTVLLGGGCFCNNILATGLYQALKKHGLSVYLPHHMPANDGGLSLGQAWVAGTKK